MERRTAYEYYRIPTPPLVPLPECNHMLNLYRRHLQKCPHRAKGAGYTKCSCPVWCDGELNGERYRHSLGTRNWGRAGFRLAKLEAPGARQPKPIPEAIEAFHTSVGNLAVATRTKYQRVLRFFSTVGPPPLALPILPHIVPFSVPVRGGQTRITGGMGCSRQLSVNTSQLLRSNSVHASDLPKHRLVFGDERYSRSEE